MEKNESTNTEVIMAGLGGMGVLMAGRILAWAALEKYRHVSWFPTYAVEKRGGLCECTVIFSQDRIPSPIIDQAQSIVVFTGSQFKPFETRVRPGGMMLVDNAGHEELKRERDDYQLLTVPGMEAAHSLGNIQVSNLILLGGYIGATNALPPELVESAIERGVKADKTVIERNQQAFRKGIELSGARPG
jgi:2-oxoglutarate ferredoxin oxidoreductase subunit gamma